MATEVLTPAPFEALDKLLELGWEEDIGPGDITSRATIPEDHVTTAIYTAKQKGIAAGMPLIDHLVKKLGPGLEHIQLVSDGDPLQSGTEMGRLTGSTRVILALERLLLNFLQHLCGIATKSSVFHKLTEGSKTVILDTRKTLPGFRALEKYAVRIGGSTNHRFGLHDRVLIKDNHIQACGSVKKAVDRTYAEYGDKYTIEAEVTSLDQLKTLKDSKVAWVMLDNMEKIEMVEAVGWKDTNMPHVMLEASGNMTREKVKDLTHIGLDYISVGALTHSVEAMDISLKFTGSPED